MKIYLTFGQIHHNVLDGVVFDKDCVAVIQAENEGLGRARAFELFGDVWFTSHIQLSDVCLEYYPRGLIEAPERKE